MRIIAGQHRGRSLTAPPGRDVRPTSDRAREALFDILAHGAFAAPPGFGEVAVLDAFAGTGAVGLEALSRGARRASFIERDPATRRVLAANIAALGETARARIIAGDACRPPAPEAPCGLAFLDPPYGANLAAPALLALDAAGWFATGAIIVVELGAREALEPPTGFSLIERRRYGAAGLVFLAHTA